MMQQTSGFSRSGGRLILAAILTGLWFGASGPVFPATDGQNLKSEVHQQIETQGRLLLGNLRRAREMGLRGDPWAMAYALQEAHRLVNQIEQVERMLYAKLSPKDERSSLQQPKKPLLTPLDERLDIDVPTSDGRRQRLTDLEQYAGYIPLQQVRTAIARASRALSARPPDLASALRATNQALSDVHWQPGLEPAGWVRVRDLILQGYTLTLNSRPGAFELLVRAQRKLGSMPGGGVYARRLARLVRAPTLEPVALRVLVEDLDRKVQVLRSRAERVRLERATVKLRP
jgi:hypothetical protein